MVIADDGAEAESRPPTLDDLLGLCRSLNEHGAKYVVIGGMAMIQAGYVRATEDIDLLLDPSPENQRKVRSALLDLPDQAVRELGEDDLNRYAVVRVADEFVVDLMTRAGGLDFVSIQEEVILVELQGVPIPFASPGLLWKLKQTGREKDRLDLLFLRELLGNTE